MICFFSYVIVNCSLHIVMKRSIREDSLGCDILLDGTGVTFRISGQTTLLQPLTDDKWRHNIFADATFLSTVCSLFPQSINSIIQFNLTTFYAIYYLFFNRGILVFKQKRLKKSVHKYLFNCYLWKYDHTVKLTHFSSSQIS